MSLGSLWLWDVTQEPYHSYFSSLSTNETLHCWTSWFKEQNPLSLFPFSYYWYVSASVKHKTFQIFFRAIWKCTYNWWMETYPWLQGNQGNTGLWHTPQVLQFGSNTQFMNLSFNSICKSVCTEMWEMGILIASTALHKGWAGGSQLTGLTALIWGKSTDRV